MVGDSARAHVRVSASARRERQGELAGGPQEEDESQQGQRGGTLTERSCVPRYSFELEWINRCAVVSSIIDVATAEESACQCGRFASPLKKVCRTAQ